MSKYTITRTENIPFADPEGGIMQMKQFEVTVSVTQEDGESLEDIEKELEVVLARNLEKAVSNGDIYKKQKKQLLFLVDKIKTLLPNKAREIITAAKNLKI